MGKLSVLKRLDFSRYIKFICWCVGVYVPPNSHVIWRRNVGIKFLLVCWSSVKNWRLNIWQTRVINAEGREQSKKNRNTIAFMRLECHFYSKCLFRSQFQFVCRNPNSLSCLSNVCLVVSFIPCYSSGETFNRGLVSIWPKLLYGT